MKPFTFISYLTEMGMYMIDTYLLVLIAVSEINNANYVIKQENLIQQLHVAIQVMHADSLIQHLQSCIKETILSALSRYVALGILESKSYSGQNGSHTTFLSSPNAVKGKLDAIFEQFVGIYRLSKEELGLWGERISGAVEKSLVVTMARSKL